jgi:hypothetical protein
VARRNKKDLRAHLKHSFWVINISKQNVCLADLALTIRVGRSYNLLDNNHFSYTLKQLQDSSKSGSLFKKRDKILVRDTPPKVIVKPGVYISNQPMPTRRVSPIKIEEPTYEELIFSDEKFADDYSDYEVADNSTNSKEQ